MGSIEQEFQKVVSQNQIVRSIMLAHKEGHLTMEQALKGSIVLINQVLERYRKYLVEYSIADPSILAEKDNA